MGPKLNESSLVLVALACRRGPDDLSALAAMARGESIDPQRAQSLVRAGLLRASKTGPKLPAELIAPVLALDASLGGQGSQLISELVAMLAGADGAQRDVLLDALTEQLQNQLEQLRGLEVSGSSVEALLAALNDLQQATGRLQDEGLSTSRATRLAALCAQLVEQLARHAQPKRLRKSKDPLNFSFEAAAAVSRTRVVCLTQPLRLPCAQRLAASAVGSRTPPVSERQARMEDASHGNLSAEVVARSGSANPSQSLYSDCSGVVEALQMHGALIALGEEHWNEAGLVSASEIIEGPRPLQWSTSLSSRKVGERAA
jgi:hypothetical protein